MSVIYQALKDVGFRETYWQYVYPGQIGGLIKSPRSHSVEFHVRFFEEGMIYAEFELGRSALLHFLGQRYYLNGYILQKIRSRLAVPEIEYWQQAVDRYKAAFYRDWPEWSGRNRFMTARTKRQLRLFAILSDWRLLATLMFASVIVSLVHGPAALAILIALVIVIYLLAPKRS